MSAADPTTRALLHTADALIARLGVGTVSKDDDTATG